MESVHWPGIRYYHVVFLIENGRNRSNSRHISEMLSFVKLQMYIALYGKKNDILEN
jgi:hypothetical protein